MSGISAEYIWFDGTKPTPQLRSKTKILIAGETPPIWGFDGSSTIHTKLMKVYLV